LVPLEVSLCATMQYKCIIEEKIILPYRFGIVIINPDFY